ncbi:amidohydrolase [Sabulicella glaciei]|uniref:Amidohydrolase n=1 Tax=Sabulicella glaciei TaxID=2984948 RepID=A0ABT3P3J9_9PROT|nr:amidohydrolase [Roseococcus sp. MDT2-1-1]MCW8088359.1 amidohydrolase [Roseococcus sp. MDT2-1-1]
MIVRHVRPWGGAPTDIAVEGDRIVAITPSAAKGPSLLALPGLVEGHCHLDKTFWGRLWWRNEVGPRREDRIANDRVARRSLDPRREGRALAEEHLRNGTTRLRSHVDIDDDSRLRHVEALLLLREEMQGRMEIQLVAFPQAAILRTRGCEEWMDEALRMGCDAVGGLDPSLIDRDPVGHLDAVFRLAERHGKPVDIHLHEPGELGAFALELVAERTRALSMKGRVTVSHAFALGEVAPERAAALYALLAETGVSLCTSAPAYRATPSVRRAREAGVVLFAGNDNIRDGWNPANAPDMRERAEAVALKNDFRRDDEVEWALETVSTLGAQGCGFADYGLTPGARADIVLLEADTPAEAVVSRDRPVRVISHGRDIPLARS